MQFVVFFMLACAVVRSTINPQPASEQITFSNTGVCIFTSDELNEGQFLIAQSFDAGHYSGF
ncbi:MAG: hypothetical protein ACI9Y1_003608 [Lentisphaeria bacterium]|jgi:hypothetical protein